MAAAAAAGEILKKGKKQKRNKKESKKNKFVARVVLAPCLCHVALWKSVSVAETRVHASEYKCRSNYVK